MPSSLVIMSLEARLLVSLVLYYEAFFLKFALLFYSMAGVTTANVDYLAKAIHEVTKHEP